LKGDLRDYMKLTKNDDDIAYEKKKKPNTAYLKRKLQLDRGEAR